MLERKLDNGEIYGFSYEGDRIVVMVPKGAREEIQSLDKSIRVVELSKAPEAL